MKLNNKECEILLKRIENADKEKVLHLVLNRTLSYINLRELYKIIENLKSGNCNINDREHYLIDNDLKEWEEKQKTPQNNITVTVKGFNTFEEANQFCSWYCGQGEQDASIWFEERKSEGLITSRFMESQIIQKTDNNNIDMILKMHK